jgi:hypothetical protein
MIISRQILRMRNVSDKSCRKNKNTYLCSIMCFRKSCRLWDNVEKYDWSRQATGDNIMRRMRFTCWVTKATDTHPKCTIFIAFPMFWWSPQFWGIRKLLPVFLLFHSMTQFMQFTFSRLTPLNALFFEFCFQCLLCFVVATAPSFFVSYPLQSPPFVHSVQLQ